MQAAEVLFLRNLDIINEVLLDLTLARELDGQSTSLYRYIYNTPNYRKKVIFTLSKVAKIRTAQIAVQGGNFNPRDRGQRTRGNCLFQSGKFGKQQAGYVSSLRKPFKGALNRESTEQDWGLKWTKRLRQSLWSKLSWVCSRNLWRLHQLQGLCQGLYNIGKKFVWIQ